MAGKQRIRKTSEEPVVKTIDPSKLFNALSSAFMGELGKMFTHETTLRFIKEELDRYSSKKCKTPWVPGLKFYKSMQIKTGIKDAKGTEFTLGDMILDHNDRLFSDECTADIPELSAINLKAKWKDLNDKNRAIAWDYLDRMARSSAQVASTQALKSGELDDVTSSIREIADKLPPGMSDEEKIKAVLSDPKIADAAATINKKLGEMGITTPSSSSRK